ncbi:MAG: M48 family metallopeptidase [Anaerolineales bacterium]|nr:M48 family metallopeptidase [Anaerolineales bacterium]
MDTSNHLEDQPSQANLDPVRQEKAKEYGRIKRRLMLVDMLMVGLYTIAWLFPSSQLFGEQSLRASATLRDILYGITTNEWLVVAGFMLVFGGIYSLLTIPLAYYSGFILPHRYDLSTQTLPGWMVDQVKGLVVGGFIGLIVIQVIYALLRLTPDLWWLWVAGVMLVFNVVLANLGPVLLLPIFYKLAPLDQERPDLVERLTKLAERAGTRVRGVYKFDMSRRTKAANAALTGLGNTRRIILGDTLLQEFRDDEIETVLAHELAHHVHKDIPLGMLVGSVMTLGGLYLASLGINWGVQTFGFLGVDDVAAFPILMIVMGIFGLVTMPLQNGFSRWRERRADDYALMVTGKKEAYASALTRLANQNLAEIDPEPWVEILLMSHPPLGKRIRMAENY